METSTVYIYNTKLNLTSNPIFKTGLSNQFENRMNLYNKNNCGKIVFQKRVDNKNQDF